VSKAESESKGQNRGRTESETAGTGTNYSEAVQALRNRGKTLSRSRANGHSQTTGRTASVSEGESRSLSCGQSVSTALARALSIGGSISEGDTLGESETVTLGGSRSEGQSISIQPTPLARFLKKLQETGKLRRNQLDQIGELTQMIMTLPKQHCRVSVSGFPLAFTIRVADVHCAFERRGVSALWRERAIASLKETMYQMHPYYFSHDRGSRERLIQNVVPELPKPAADDDPHRRG